MRATRFLVALVAPCVTHGFLATRALPKTPAPARASSSFRQSSAIMTLRPNLNRLQVAGTVLLGGALLVTGVVAGADVARADISMSPRCITGEGAQCDDLSEGNELIKSLQAKSALSKDKYFQDTLDKYNDHNFKDYFRAENKHMVRHKNGKYEILTNADYAEAEKAGKVKDEAFIE